MGEKNHFVCANAFDLFAFTFSLLGMSVLYGLRGVGWFGAGKGN